jgi:hypothetical protein
MKGFIQTTLAGLGLAGGLVAGGGCMAYRECVDPCYPSRYSYLARQEVRQSVASQMYNGHTLDQTVWNYHFEAGTDKLTPGGLEFLEYLARRRPGPDTKVFIQTAEDVAYDPAAPDKTVEARTNLDAKRAEAVQRFLRTQTPSLVYDLIVHNPHEVGMYGVPMTTAVNRHFLAAQGVLTSGVGSVGGAGTGAGAPGGAGAVPPR